MFGYIALGIIAFFFILIPEAAFIIFGGVLIALINLSLARALKKRIPGSKALLIFFVVVLVLIGAVGIGWLVSSRIADEMETFAQQFPPAFEEVLTSLKETAWFEKISEEADKGDWIENFIAPKILPKTAKVATVFLNGLTAFGLSLLLGVYMAIDSGRYAGMLKMLVPRKQQELYSRLGRSLVLNLQGWLLAKLLSMFAVATLTYIGLLLLGIKAAFPLAFIAGFLGFVPNIGPILSAVPAMTIAFPKGLNMVLYVVILYVAIQAAEGTLITPLINKRRVSILPAGLILFQFIMAILYGFGGLFMATPILVVLMTTVKELWVENPNR